jgi:hypothetical protein
MWRATYAALALLLAPWEGWAQQQLGSAELARAKFLLDLHKAELSAEQYALLSTRLAQTQQAYAELLAASGETMAAGAAAEAAAATGGRAILGSVAEVLPLLLFFWPATAHAPGMKDEKPQVRAARGKLEKRLKELAEAKQQVEAEVAKRPKATGSGGGKDVQCSLDREYGGFVPPRPGVCEYKCTDGRSLCKLVRKGRSCPGAPLGEYFPISELDNIEDCP